MTGYLGHVVTQGTPYHSLEGPVIGIRVATFHYNTDNVDEGQFVPLNCHQKDSTHEPGHYVILYRTFENAEELSHEDDNDALTTGPREVDQRI